MSWSSRKKNRVHFFICLKKFLNICVLSQCIVQWINFQNNVYTFKYQKHYFVHFCCLFLKSLKAFSVFLRHIQAYSDLCVTLACTTVPYSELLTHLEPEASSKACRTSKMLKHIKSPGIVRTVYSSIFKDI